MTLEGLLLPIPSLCVGNNVLFVSFSFLSACELPAIFSRKLAAMFPWMNSDVRRAKRGLILEPEAIMQSSHDIGPWIFSSHHLPHNFRLHSNS